MTVPHSSMPQSLANVIIHLVFSTKDRATLLSSAIRPNLHAYLATVVRTTPADLETLLAYIDHQEEHHLTRTFQDEYRAFLVKYGVAYDERYVWD
jgi:hypothetical protein